jgi:carotenoid cleavage dioxygenase-like enzyme
MKCDERREIFGGNVTHNHDKDSDASLNRQILNLSKGKQRRTCMKDRAT